MSSAYNQMLKLIEAGVGYEPEHYDLINEAFGFEEHYKTMYVISAWRGSMDAALELHRLQMPRHYWQVEEWDGAWSVTIPTSASEGYKATSEMSAARAWLCAILKGEIAQQTKAVA
jgi:hypothetical protein